MCKALALGLRTDQAKVAEVASAQNRLCDAQIEIVAVRQHQVARSRRRMAHLAVDLVDAQLADVRRPLVRAERRRKLRVPFIDPVHADVQGREKGCDRAADMTGAIQLQMKERWRHWPA